MYYVRKCVILKNSVKIRKNILKEHTEYSTKKGHLCEEKIHGYREKRKFDIINADSRTLQSDIEGSICLASRYKLV